LLEDNLSHRRWPGRPAAYPACGGRRLLWGAGVSGTVCCC